MLLEALDKYLRKEFKTVKYEAKYITHLG